MTDGFSPLMSEVVDSTLWEEPLPVRVLFVTMLALKGMDQVVRMPLRRLAKKANMDQLEVEGALRVLLGPDERSTEKQEHDGRRIEAVEGGWLVLNGEKYQEMMFEIMRRSKRAEAQRQRRARAKLGVGLPNEAAAIAARDNGNDELADRLTEERKSVPSLPFDHPLPDAEQSRQVLETLAGKPKLNYQQGVKVDK